jgi:hypothetical protein
MEELKQPARHRAGRAVLHFLDAFSFLFYPHITRGRRELSFDGALFGRLFDPDRSLDDVDDTKRGNHDDHAQQSPDDAALALIPTLGIIALVNVLNDAPNENDEREPEEKDKERLYDGREHLCHEFFECHLLEKLWLSRDGDTRSRKVSSRLDIKCTCDELDDTDDRDHYEKRDNTTDHEALTALLIIVR